MEIVYLASSDGGHTLTLGHILRKLSLNSHFWVSHLFKSLLNKSRQNIWSEKAHRSDIEAIEATSSALMHLITNE